MIDAYFELYKPILFTMKVVTIWRNAREISSLLLLIK